MPESKTQPVALLPPEIQNNPRLAELWSAGLRHGYNGRPPDPQHKSSMWYKRGYREGAEMFEISANLGMFF